MKGAAPSPLFQLTHSRSVLVVVNTCDSSDIMSSSESEDEDLPSQGTHQEQTEDEDETFESLVSAPSRFNNS